jgi:GntR family transcriptional regulator
VAEDPKFELLAAKIRADVAAGKYDGGKRLPGEDALAAECKVSLTTVRNAMDSLVSEGLLERRPRSGFYVRVYRRVLRDANKRLAATQWGSGLDVWDVDAAGRERAVDNIEVFHSTNPPEDVATRLGTADVWIRRRRYLLDGRPVQLATSYLPTSIVEGSPITMENTGAGGTYARLADLGYAPAEFVERLLARMPTADETQSLGLLPATPVLPLRREAITAEGRIVEVNDMLLAGDAYVLQWRFPA